MAASTSIEESVRDAHVVLFRVKTLDTETATREMQPFPSPYAAVLSFQNAVDNVESHPQCAYNAISALTRARYGCMARFEPVRVLMQPDIAETLAVANAEGVFLSEPAMMEAALQAARHGASSGTASALRWVKWPETAQGSRRSVGFAEAGARTDSARLTQAYTRKEVSNGVPQGLPIEPANHGVVCGYRTLFSGTEPPRSCRPG